jgi:replicative DNA helicase
MPKISDLRDSGWLEADARAIWLLHRPHYYWEAGYMDHNSDDEPDEHEMMAILAKNNYGPTGATKLWCKVDTSYIGDEPSIPF